MGEKKFYKEKCHMRHSTKDEFQVKNSLNKNLIENLSPILIFSIYNILFQTFFFLPYFPVVIFPSETSAKVHLIYSRGSLEKRLMCQLHHYIVKRIFTIYYRGWGWGVQYSDLIFFFHPFKSFPFFFAFIQKYILFPSIFYKRVTHFLSATAAAHVFLFTVFRNSSPKKY